MGVMMRAQVARFAIAAAAFIAAPILSGEAMAGCVSPDLLQLKHKTAFIEPLATDPGVLTLADYAPASIVGLWSVKFISGGKLIDFGYSVWHSDGTEFLNSGGRAPVTQNYCLGVWARTAANTYKLNHWAISYDEDGKHNANVNIRELVKLGAGGNTFGGTFSIQAYDPESNAPLGPEVDGTISGKRVTVD